jgi:hypothetical protein
VVVAVPRIVGKGNAERTGENRLVQALASRSNNFAAPVYAVDSPRWPSMDLLGGSWRDQFRKSPGLCSLMTFLAIICMSSESKGSRRTSVMGWHQAEFHVYSS